MAGVPRQLAADLLSREREPGRDRCEKQPGQENEKHQRRVLPRERRERREICGWKRRQPRPDRGGGGGGEADRRNAGPRDVRPR